uniref:Putative PD-(D/E)XK nuclease superfamily protein n=1 Tax=viral metagenome TaxID=1070528 RepID=A0A6M3KRK5_9ZZZZ
MNIKDLKSLPIEARQSSIACVYACKRKWLLKYRLGITLRGEQIKESANLGQIYHRFKQLGPGREDEVRKWVRDRQTALMSQVDAGEDLDGTLARLANLLTELYHKAEVMAHIFWERFPLPPYLEVIGREIDVSVPISLLGFYSEGSKILIGGRLDSLLRNKEDGNIWIRDDKSTGRALETVFAGLGWSIQARLYRILADHYLTEGAVRGFIMDGIVKPGIKLCGKDEKTAKAENITPQEAYLRRVRQWYMEQEGDMDRKMIDSKALIFAESLYPPELVSAIMMIDTLAKAPCESAHHLESEFPRDITRQACMQYETQCEYHDLCDRHPDYWDELFECKYHFIAGDDSEESTGEIEGAKKGKE